MPQKEAPRHNPTNVAQVVYRTLFELTPNSDVNDGNVSATICLVSQFTVSRLFWRSDRKILPEAPGYVHVWSVYTSDPQA